MDLVEQSATKVAQYINRNVDNASSVAVLKMSLITVINFFIVAFGVIIVCLFTGRLAEGVIALICAPLLRYFSGGIHMKSAQLCNLISLIIILVAAHLSISYAYTGLGLTIAAMLILLLYAPQGILNLSRLKAQYYPILKLIAIIIVATNLLFQSPVLAIAFFLQSITIIPLAQKLVDYYKI